MDTDRNSYTSVPNNLENDQRRPRKKFFQKRKLWLAMVFGLFALVLTTSLLVYSYVYTDEDERNFSLVQSNTTCRFTGLLNLSDPCLWDSWVQNETTFQNRITDVYSKSPMLQHYFISADIDYNSMEENKSAIINLKFHSPSRESKYPISIELVEGILRQDLHYEGSPACHHSRTSEDSFQVTSLNI